MARVEFVLDPNSINEQNSVVDILSVVPARETFSESYLDDPEFIEIPHTEHDTYETSAGNQTTSSSLHSITRDVTNDRQDAVSTVSGISSIFEGEDDETIVIPIVQANAKNDFSECLDSSQLLDDIVNANKADDQQQFFESSIQPLEFSRASSLQACSKKADLLKDIFDRATQRLRYVDENLPRLEIVLDRQLSTAGGNKCPYKSWLNEFSSQSKYSHEAYVVLKKKT